jgi:hypothetical protein
MAKRVFTNNQLLPFHISTFPPFLQSKKTSKGSLLMTNVYLSTIPPFLWGLAVTSLKRVFTNNQLLPFHLSTFPHFLWRLSGCLATFTTPLPCALLDGRVSGRGLER